MVRPHDRTALSVRSPDDSLRLIRVTGRLDVGGAATVLRMVSAQLELVAAGHRSVTDLVLDLTGVTGFETAGVTSLRHARFAAGQRGVTVHLCGFDARRHLLPAAAYRVLLDFRSFPSAEVAIETLLDVPPIAVPAQTFIPVVTAVPPPVPPAPVPRPVAVPPAPDPAPTPTVTPA
ncbi:STAS domain-containing protein [Pseudonocardia sediminis]|uniref:STAS domain-containing protein n=1 Tax=Pseudonocardia sediminis TaxID=1397368 RepID=UPI00102A0A12|nr:STAS domain-containing protein [Pseudonocardia sediminis]